MRKAKLKIIQYGAVGFFVLVALPAVGLYIAATRTPKDYHPLLEYLTREEREDIAQRFIVTVANFHNSAQNVEPFTWSITSDQLNEYLGSMDAIAWTLLPTPPPEGAATRPDPSFESYASRFQAQMDGLGLGGWCGAVTDDGIRLMVKSTKYNKIFSATLEFEVKDDKQMWVRITHARFGTLMIPKWIIRNGLVKLRESMARRGTRGEDPARAHAGRKPNKDVIVLLESLLDMAIDDRPREPVLSVPGKIKPTLIEKVEISNGTLTIHARPIRRGAAEDTAPDQP
ncbi:MAG: hypothetical protein NTV86_02945 [Planctomycetota bacterium]|nr:hypothetical protein [Planctomycetota bacterium]